MATLWLVGMMGSGKTTVAPMVAARTGRSWIDTDAEIERHTGAAVGELVAADEPRFREMERSEVARIAGVDAVVSCGGGVVLDDASVALMRATGMVVHLEASPGVLVQRVGAGEGRPLLSGGVETSLRRIHGERAVSYREAAHVVVDADADPETVAERVLEAWTRWS